MTISLYEASVVSYLQTLGAVSHVLDLGLKHCRQQGIDPDEIVETRLHADMLPFRFQIVSVVHHSLGTVAALRSGQFLPPSDRRLHDYAALQGLVTDANDAMRKVTAEEINSRAGHDVVFQVQDFRREFTTEGFVLSFSLPNVHFHAATAYDILRMRGVPVGKRDFMGQLRLKS